MCAYSTINEKVLGSTNVNERKILASDVNQIREVIQTGAKDLKTGDIAMVGNTITADNGSNWIRRNGNTFQFHNGTSWQEPSTDTLLTFTAGENIAARDVVYLKVSDGKIYKASTSNNDWIGVATAAITSGASGTIHPNGYLVGGFSGLTSGTWYGLNATAGTLTANENYIVGKAISATQIILVKPKVDISTRDNSLYKLQGEKAINDVSATNSGVIAGSSQVLIDKFLDSTGQNNTVDIGNTDAVFDTSNLVYLTKRISITNITNPVLEPSFETITNWTYYTDDDGQSGGAWSVGVSTAWKTDGTYSYMFSHGLYGANTYAQITQNVDFTNINYLLIDMNFIKGTNSTQSFSILIDGVEVYSRDATTYGSEILNYPIDCRSITGIKSLTFKARHYAPNTNNAITYIDNIRNAQFANSTIHSSTKTIPSGKTKVFVTPLMYEELETGDSITADVSIDNGSTYTTDVPINEWTPITSTNGTSLIVKANLNTNDGTTTPKILGWRVLLE